MSLAGLDTGAGARPAQKEKKYEKGHHESEMIPASSIEIDSTFDPPSQKPLFVQVTTSMVALVLWLLRKYQIALLGSKVNLFLGVVPYECVLLSAVVLGLALRDAAQELTLLRQRKKN